MSFNQRHVHSYFVPWVVNVNKLQRKPMGKSRMDNSETSASSGMPDTERRQTKQKNTTQKTRKVGNTDHTKN